MPRSEHTCILVLIARELGLSCVTTSLSSVTNLLKTLSRFWFKEKMFNIEMYKRGHISNTTINSVGKLKAFSHSLQCYLKSSGEILRVQVKICPRSVRSDAFVLSHVPWFCVSGFSACEGLWPVCLIASLQTGSNWLIYQARLRYHNIA